ncbi:MAG: hypothetical protein AAF628_25135 [Planctomycetota bacterium]
MDSPEIVVLTEQLLDAGRSEKRGWSKAQLALFGVDGFPKGWKKALIGRPVPREFVDRFLALKNAHHRGPKGGFDDDPLA